MFAHGQTHRSAPTIKLLVAKPTLLRLILAQMKLNTEQIRKLAVLVFNKLNRGQFIKLLSTDKAIVEKIEQTLLADAN